MLKNFYYIHRKVNDHKEALALVTEHQFQLLKEHNFDYESVEQDDWYQLNDDYIDHTIDCIQTELDHVRTWNHKLHRQRLLRDYEDHMKRAGDYIKKEES